MEYIFVIYDSKFQISKKDKALIIDLGANLGQAYKFFSRFYSGSNISFELFEPNPYCFKEIKKLEKKRTKVFNTGVSIKNQFIEFYGLSSNNRFSLGGSTVKIIILSFTIAKIKK